MIFYRPTDGDVFDTPVPWRPRTCFLMAQMKEPPPAELAKVRKRLANTLQRAKYRIVDAGSETTGKDFLLKVWKLAVSCPIGIAIVHQGIRPETMANIYYELGWMQSYGRETVVIKVGDMRLPSDLVRTEYIPFDSQFDKRVGEFILSLKERAGYYLNLADQLEKNPLLAIDYLRRAFLLTGAISLRKRASAIFEESGLADRARDSVERLMAKF